MKKEFLSCCRKFDAVTWLLVFVCFCVVLEYIGVWACWQTLIFIAGYGVIAGALLLLGLLMYRGYHAITPFIRKKFGKK